MTARTTSMGARTAGGHGDDLPAARPRCHIWSEFVPHRDLCDGAVLAPLAERDIQLVVAVTPEVTHSFADVVAACREHRVRVALWPMVANRDGRWASAANVGLFAEYTADLCARLADADALPDEVALDFEPPYPPGDSRGLIGLARRWLRSYSTPQVAGRFRALMADLAALGLAVSAAVPPMCVQPSAGAARGWQRVLGVPFADLPLDRVSVMAYTTLLQGYSRGALGRRDALSVLWHCARATRQVYGDRAGLSLGAVGVGALGDERCYPSPAELAQDVAIARAGGITDLSLFNLGGALDRPPLHSWLDALVTTPPAEDPPATTARARAALALAVGIGHAGRLL